MTIKTQLLQAISKFERPCTRIEIAQAMGGKRAEFNRLRSNDTKLLKELEQEGLIEIIEEEVTYGTGYRYLYKATKKGRVQVPTSHCVIVSTNDLQVFNLLLQPLKELQSRGLIVLQLPE